MSTKKYLSPGTHFVYDGQVPRIVMLPDAKGKIGIEGARWIVPEGAKGTVLAVVARTNNRRFAEGSVAGYKVEIEGFDGQTHVGYVREYDVRPV